MTSTTYFHIVIAVVIVGLSTLLVNPFMFWMPGMLQLLVLGVLLAAVGAFAALVLREGAADEREEALRMRSGRAAFIAGALISVLGIAYQGYSGAVDPWLVSTLCAMVLAKLITRIYTERCC